MESGQRALLSVWVIAVAGLSFVLLFLACGAGDLLSVFLRLLANLLGMLAFGWIRLPIRKLTPVTIDGSAVLFGMCVVAVFAVGSHFFLAWLYANWRRSAALAGDAPTEPAHPRRVWQPRWTVAGLGGVLMMFVAGISMVGLVHQLVWLPRTEIIENRSMVKSLDRANR